MPARLAAAVPAPAHRAARRADDPDPGFRGPGRPRARAACAVLAALLAACGGGEGPMTDAAAATPAPAGSTGPGAATTPVTAGSTTPVAAPAAPPASTACGDPAVEAAALARINAVRAAGATCGGQRLAPVAPLQADARLTRAAQAHATDMATNRFFSHTSSDGSDIGRRLTAAGYDWRSAAENIAAGYRTAGEAVDSWVASPGHCANLMSPTLTEAGLACVPVPGRTSYPSYWTLTLGRPR